MTGSHPLLAICNKKNLVAAILMLSVIVSGLAVSYAAYKNRRLHNQLQQMLEGQNRAQVEWGRLLLEESTLTTPVRVEKLAREKLNMDVPNPGDVEMVAQ